MASEIAVALIGGGAGLVSGAIGSLIAPWSQWGVEKRRLRREGRVGKLAEWRAGIADLDQAGADCVAAWELDLPETSGAIPHDLLKAELAVKRLLDLHRFSWFQSLSDWIDPALREKLRSPLHSFRPPGSDGTQSAYGYGELAGVVAAELAAQVAQIERRWKLA